MPKTHKMTGTSEYKSWDAMKRRCLYPKCTGYSDYGGRGIKISNSWRNSFENFFADMGLKPSPAHSLDRIDNNGDYQADNCRWATREQQDNNKRNNRLITIGCVTLNLKQWTTEMGFGGSNVILERLKLGWSEKDAVLSPVRTDRLIKIDSKTYTIPEWTTEMGFGKTVINKRLKRGWSERDAVLIPVGGKRNR